MSTPRGTVSTPRAGRRTRTPSEPPTPQSTSFRREASHRRGRHLSAHPAGASYDAATPLSHGKKKKDYEYDEEADHANGYKAQFDKIQKEIMESVERADTKLLEYTIFEQEKEAQLEMEQTERSDADSALSLTIDDVNDMIPAEEPPSCSCSFMQFFMYSPRTQHQ
jgi:hypothetical protein